MAERQAGLQPLRLLHRDEGTELGGSCHQVPSGRRPVKRPGVATLSSAIRSRTMRRSRKRFVRSQLVSLTKRQKWQAAPWRKSSLPLGARWEQIGSEEHRVPRRRASRTTSSSLSGLASSTNPPSVPSLSEDVVLMSKPAAGETSSLLGQAKMRSVRLAEP